jgi:hypothetical protein
VNEIGGVAAKMPRPHLTTPPGGITLSPGAGASFGAVSPSTCPPVDLASIASIIAWMNSVTACLFSGGGLFGGLLGAYDWSKIMGGGSQ